MSTLRIPLPPAGFQRPRPRNPYNLAAGWWNPHQTALDDWKFLITNQLKLHQQPIIEGPVSVCINISPNRTVIEVTPVVGSQPARPKGVRQDLDNLIKFVNDALQDLAFYNDSQVVAISAVFSDDT